MYFLFLDDIILRRRVNPRTDRTVVWSLRGVRPAKHAAWRNGGPRGPNLLLHGSFGGLFMAPQRNRLSHAHGSRSFLKCANSKFARENTCENSTLGKFSVPPRIYSISLERAGTPSSDLSFSLSVRSVDVRKRTPSAVSPVIACVVTAV